jgi:S1-C subfamily serine protease
MRRYVYSSRDSRHPGVPFFRPWLIIGAAITGLMVTWFPAILAWVSPTQEAQRSVTPRGELAADELATIQLFEKSRDSVVYISTSQLVRDIWSRNVLAVPRGTGSGFIWDDAGDVVTNFHVIEGSGQAEVRLADGRDYKAKLIGASPEHDIAVLRIDLGPNHPSPVPIGTSADLRVGQKVFAIGNPFGLDWTLTNGIVSALDRSLPSEGGASMVEHLIQTDAPINPGNSGGPLLDSAGRLIGINTAIFSPSGASAGIGFAVPVDVVMRVVPQLIKQGSYKPPSLGIEADDGLNRRLSSLFGHKGVFVLRTMPGSGAEKAGLNAVTVMEDGRIVPGDIIVGIEGKPIESVSGMMARLDDFKVGDVVAIDIVRGRDSRRIPVKLH